MKCQKYLYKFKSNLFMNSKPRKNNQKTFNYVKSYKKKNKYLFPILLQIAIVTLELVVVVRIGEINIVGNDSVRNAQNTKRKQVLSKYEEKQIGAKDHVI